MKNRNLLYAKFIIIMLTSFVLLKFSIFNIVNDEVLLSNYNDNGSHTLDYGNVINIDNQHEENAKTEFNEGTQSDKNSENYDKNDSDNKQNQDKNNIKTGANDKPSKEIINNDNEKSIDKIEDKTVPYGSLPNIFDNNESNVNNDTSKNQQEVIDKNDILEQNDSNIQNSQGISSNENTDNGLYNFFKFNNKSTGENNVDKSQNQDGDTADTPTNNNTTSSSDDSEISVESFNDLTMKVIELVNIERSKISLKSLKYNAKVNQVATLKSEDMVKNNYFSHNSPIYGTPFEMLSSQGVSYKTAGENIAKGQSSAIQVMDSWMNSTGHRENILNSNFTDIGVGIAKNSKGQLIWTQQFIG